MADFECSIEADSAKEKAIPKIITIWHLFNMPLQDLNRQRFSASIEDENLLGGLGQLAIEARPERQSVDHDAGDQIVPTELVNVGACSASTLTV